MMSPFKALKERFTTALDKLKSSTGSAERLHDTEHTAKNDGTAPSLPPDRSPAAVHRASPPPSAEPPRVNPPKLPSPTESPLAPEALLYHAPARARDLGIRLD